MSCSASDWRTVIRYGSRGSFSASAARGAVKKYRNAAYSLGERQIVQNEGIGPSFKNLEVSLKKACTSSLARRFAPPKNNCLIRGSIFFPGSQSKGARKRGTLKSKTFRRSQRGKPGGSTCVSGTKITSLNRLRSRLSIRYRATRLTPPTDGIAMLRALAEMIRACIWIPEKRGWSVVTLKKKSGSLRTTCGSVFPL